MNKSMEDAVRFISGEIKDNPDVNMSKLIEEASRKFDLDPMQTDFLINKYVLGI